MRTFRLRIAWPRQVASVASTAAIACVIASTAATLTTASASAGATPASRQADTSPPPGATHTVTLLTGDRVEYTELSGDRPRVVVDPPGRSARSAVTFTTMAVAGPGGRPALYVVPSDAEAYLAAGTVDRELFNIRELTRERLDDADATSLPVIVTYQT